MHNLGQKSMLSLVGIFTCVLHNKKFYTFIIVTQRWHKSFKTDFLLHFFSLKLRKTTSIIDVVDNCFTRALYYTRTDYLVKTIRVTDLDM